MRRRRDTMAGSSNAAVHSTSGIDTAWEMRHGGVDWANDKRIALRLLLSVWSWGHNTVLREAWCLWESFFSLPCVVRGSLLVKFFSLGVPCELC